MRCRPPAANVLPHHREAPAPDRLFQHRRVPQLAPLIHDILITSRVNNLRDDICGLLVAGGNRYLQVIEGPRRQMEALYANIRADDRHLAVTTLVQRPTTARCFAGWAMAFAASPRWTSSTAFRQCWAI